MRKRHKKKREIRAEIKHAAFMRGMEAMHAIVKSHVLIAQAQICQSQKFVHGGALPGDSKPVQIKAKPVDDFMPTEAFNKIFDAKLKAMAANTYAQVSAIIESASDGGFPSGPKSYACVVKGQLAADMGRCIDGEMLDKLKS